MNILLEQLSDLIIDFPTAPKAVGILLGKTIANGGLDLSFLERKIATGLRDSPVNKSPYGLAAELLAQIIPALFDDLGKSKFDALAEKTKATINLVTFFENRNQQPEFLSKFLTEKKLVSKTDGINTLNELADSYFSEHTSPKATILVPTKEAAAAELSDSDDDSRSSDYSDEEDEE